MLSLLLLITLVWGGCISCSQFYMFPRAKKDCCNSGRCDRSQAPKQIPIRECKRMPLTQAVSADLAAEAPAAIISLVYLPRPAISLLRSPVPVAAVDHSPPELHLLNSTFRI